MKSGCTRGRRRAVAGIERKCQRIGRWTQLRNQRQGLADLLNAGDFQIDSVQLMGNVMGTGTNFRWVGELRAAAERSYGTTMTGLILRDARAGMNDGVLTASSRQFNANGLVASGAS